ncbi:Hypothetical protein CINCED_3A007776 [Cinara cedri]|uniref:UDP-glucuronosyltransferase n=1 Tax=Cinara cedri TaxID=506608 RepID=A0A5E4NFA2_9HEMI|nr:Hypothetical protein CINCED_3A007776 [Cinara cedri]
MTTVPNGSRSRAAAVATACLLVAAVLSGRPRPADGARVLAVETVFARSHWNFMRGVLHALVDAGHQVKAYTPFPGRNSTAANYTEVDTYADYGDVLAAVNMNATEVGPLFSTPSFLIPFMVNGSRFTCDVLDKLVPDADGGETFDLFITEPLSSECVSHVSRRLGVPLVYTIPAPLLPWIEISLFGHYPNPSYVPHMLSAYTSPNTFFRRAHNLALYLQTVYLHYRATIAAVAAENRTYDRMPPVNPSLVFVNTHYATELARPVPANRVNVGGIHLKKPEPLPADILEFIEGSPHGVIYFTFGTVVALSTLPDTVQNAFKSALAEIPQRVLWKYEEEMKDIPKNVMTGKWFPQRDILLHPNVKLFISHGGISGVYEAVDAGVPVLGFPMFFDQPRNIEHLVDSGMAISMDLFSVTKDKLLNAINEMVNNTTYSKNAKIVLERFRDRQMSPAESVVYWTEYVIRHKGAPHLKSNALNLTWYQYFLLDVIAAVLLLVLFISFVTYRILKFIKICVLKSLTKFKSKRE